MSTPLEKALERKVVGFCKSKGLLCYKFTSPSNRGVPDRVVIGPKGVLFLELKREGCKPTPLQSYHIERIREAGGNAAWADNLDTAEALIERYCAGANGDKERAFLIGLEKLTRETGVKIGGCGCCGSPFMDELEEKEKDTNAGYGLGYAGEVSWIAPSDEYNWENFSTSIVKD